MPEQEPEQVQSEPVHTRLRRLIASKKVEFNNRQWREELQKHGVDVSIATISRDLTGQTPDIPKARLDAYAKILRVPFKYLATEEDLRAQIRQPNPPSQDGELSVKYWAFCPYKCCPTARWAVWKQTGEPAKFHDHGWFNAEEEGRYCRRCGTELVKECRTCKKQKIEHRGDLYCGTCGERFAETTIIAPHELWKRTMEDRKHYTQEQQLELLRMALWRLQDSQFDTPLDLMDDLASCVAGQLVLLQAKLQNRSALKMQNTDLRHLKNLHDTVECLRDTMTDLMSAVRASNKEFFTELEMRSHPDAKEARLEAWREHQRQKEQEKIAQGMIEPSEAGDAVVEFRPPEEHDIDIPF
jgi:hypothetical protein